LTSALIDHAGASPTKPSPEELRDIQALWDAVEAAHIRRVRRSIAVAENDSVTADALRRFDLSGASPDDLSLREPVRFILGKLVLAPLVSPTVNAIDRANARAKSVMAGASAASTR
jgi:hypothetical protein